MAYKFSPDQLLLHRIWRKAFRDGEMIIDLPTPSDAMKLRFALYNAVRPVRQGKAVDEELLKAAESCLINIAGSVLTVQSKSLMPFMQAVTAALGEEVSAEQPVPLTQEEAEIAASEERLKALLDTPEQAPERVTPYYTRP